MLAARQHGNITRVQLLALGMSSSAIVRAVHRGRLFRVAVGVYAVGRPPRTALERAMAAVLACGAGSAIAGRAGYALWDLGEWAHTIEVVGPHKHRIPGVTHRRCRTLTRRDVRHRHAIPVLAPARLILERAPWMSDRALARAVNEALRRGIMRRAELAELLDRRPRQPGAARLHEFVQDATGITRSELEDLFLSLCARHGLPRPETCVMLDGYEVDAFFREQGVIVELDGWQFHSSRHSFERDRERDAHALVHGNVTVRLTHHRMRERPSEEAQRLQRILQDRRERGG